MLARQLTRYANRIPSHRTILAFKRALVTSKTKPSSKMLVGIAQLCVTNDKASNLKKVQQLVEQAKEKCVKFLFLPECCDFIGRNRQEVLELSEPLTGKTIAAYADLAKANQMWLSLGGLHETVLDSCGVPTEKIFNAHVVINSEGNIVKVYHKLHLFDVDTPEFRFRESEVVTAGSKIVPPFDTPIGKLGLQICYDIRFPEVATQLRKMGAEVLTYPAAFAFITGKAHWEVLLRCRAIENQCYVIAAAQIGFHNPKRQSYGHALIIDPWGKILASLGEQESGIATAEIDVSKISTIRANMPCFSHRRPDVYNLTAIDSGGIEGIDRRFGCQTIDHKTIFFESPHCFAFTNLRCVVKGHCLVSTKRLAPRLADLTGDELTDLFRTVCKIEAMLGDIHETESATVTVQDGPDAGQTIEHVHFHVMPRHPGDFGHNDQIYVKLEEINENLEARSIEERIEEAEIYRNYLTGERN